MKLDTKKRSLSLAISDDKNVEKQEPKVITIKTNKLARDNRNFSGVSVSIDGDRILRKNKKRNYQKLQSQGTK